MSELRLFNRQKTRSIDASLLRTICRCLLNEVLKLDNFELGIHLVGAPKMAQVNGDYLQHEGSTDVITFDYSEYHVGPCGSPVREKGPPFPVSLCGEVFISIDDAIAQAREFRTTWQSEVVRYVVHAVLHLRGYDDLKPALRRTMKREENRLLKELSRRFDLGKLSKKRA